MVRQWSFVPMAVFKPYAGPGPATHARMHTRGHTDVHNSSWSTLKTAVYTVMSLMQNKQNVQALQQFRFHRVRLRYRV